MAKETWTRPPVAVEPVELDDTQNRQLVYWSDQASPGGVEVWAAGECPAFTGPVHVAASQVLTSAELANLKKYLLKLREAQATRAGLSKA